MSEQQKLRMLDAAYDIQQKIETLQRGMPIAISKAKTQYEKLKTRRKYNMRVEELRKRLNALNATIPA